MKIRIKLSQYGRLGIAKFALAFQAIIDALTGNLNFPTTQPSLADLQTGLNTFKNLSSLVEGGQLNKKHDRDLARTALELDLELLASFILYTAKNTSATIEEAITKIQSANFVVIQPGEHVGSLPAPGNLRSTALSRAIELEFDAVKGANFYVVLKTTGFPTETSVWTEVLTQRAKITIADCEPGQPMSFRVYAFGAAGAGQPSDYITDMAKL